MNWEKALAMNPEDLQKRIQKLKMKGIRNISENTKYINKGMGDLIARYDFEKEKFTSFEFVSQNSYAYLTWGENEINFFFCCQQTIKEIREYIRFFIFENIRNIQRERKMKENNHLLNA